MTHKTRPALFLLGILMLVGRSLEATPSATPAPTAPPGLPTATPLPAELAAWLDEARAAGAADGTTASKLYINGDRGKTTSSTSTTLSDSGKSWATNRWAGAFVKIVRGTGAGQTKEIVSNTGTQLTFSALDVSLSTDSEYIIYATEWFTELSTTGLGVVYSRPMVSNQIVYFPQGAGTNIRRMIWNPATPGHSYADDGTNKANFLARFYDQTGSKVLMAKNASGSGGATTVAVADAAAWATSPSNLVFGTSKNIGDGSYPVNGLTEKDNVVYIFKSDGAWTYNNGYINSLSSGLEKTPDANNGVACITHQQFIYYNWMHSVIRVYGSSHDDIGQDWSGYGLPDGREGVFSHFDSYTSLLAGAIDAGTGTSSVLGWDGLGWHELVRAYAANKRIRMVKVQPCEGNRN